MNTHELFALTQFATLLDKVIPILGRLLQEELPLIAAAERKNDLHRQLVLPLADLDEASRGFDPQPWHDPWGRS